MRIEHAHDGLGVAVLRGGEQLRVFPGAPLDVGACREPVRAVGVRGIPQRGEHPMRPGSLLMPI